jgi:hypothetical protein
MATRVANGCEPAAREGRSRAVWVAPSLKVPPKTPKKSSGYQCLGSNAAASKCLHCVLYAETCSRQTEKVAHRHWNVQWKQGRSVTLNAAGRPIFAVVAFEGILSISAREWVLRYHRTSPNGDLP